jgi:sugar diacid utilization regulator
VDASRFPKGVRAGLGGAVGPGRSWQQARMALRFTTSHRPVVHHDSLGALALLADVPPDVMRDNPDVAGVDRLAGDAEDLETLETYCATGSLRRAADLLHLHHSSVARRVEQIGKALGMDLGEPPGLLRARLALAAWHLLDS